MITLIICGLFLCLKNLMLIPHSPLLELSFTLNLNETSKKFNVLTMAGNLIMGLFGISVSLIVLTFAFHVLLHHLKMVKPNAKFAPLTTLFVPLWSCISSSFILASCFVHGNISSEHSPKQITKLPFSPQNLISTGSSLLSSTGVWIFMLSLVFFHQNS